MSNRWTPVLSNVSWAQLSEARSAIEGPDPELPGPGPAIESQHLEAAAILTEKMPEADWVIETDARGLIRITVRA